MMYESWPMQFWWAIKGTGGGGSGDRKIVVRNTNGSASDVYGPSTTWSMGNSTGYPLFVQTYDTTDGDEMRADITGSE